ncbi:MAG TPA: ABC transporter permease [Acidimicrobiia bacterium]|nr:ABC transporter permease [Acidimicrobiia bacterium]
MTRRGRRTPPIAVLLAVVAVVFFALPLIGLLRRVAWSDLLDTLQQPAGRDAIRLSIECSLWSTFFSVLFGVPLAYVLARATFPGRSLVRALVVLPMVLPPVVGGVALLFAFQRNNGLVGGVIYDLFDFQFTFSKWGVVLAETFVAMPFLVITVEAGLRSIDRRYEEAAASLGAGQWMVFRRVTVPMIGPALIAGAALAWARALGEFGATITFAGNIQGRTQTTPLAVYNLLETQQPVAIALSLVLLAISIAILVSLRDHWFGGMRDTVTS